MQTLKIEQGIDAKMENEICYIIRAAYEKLIYPQEKAKYISDYMDSSYGGCWRVTIGNQFHSCGTYYLQQRIKLTYKNDLIEVVRTQGDAQFEIIYKDPAMSGAIADSALVMYGSDNYIIRIQNAQQMFKNAVQQTEYIGECLESKHQGKWAVISGVRNYDQYLCMTTIAVYHM